MLVHVSCSKPSEPTKVCSLPQLTELCPSYAFSFRNYNIFPADLHLSQVNQVRDTKSFVPLTYIAGTVAWKMALQVPYWSRGEGLHCRN